MSIKAREEIVVKEKMNEQTGEITTQVERTTKAVGKPQEEPNYVKLYLAAWCTFKQVKGVNSAFLYEILQYMSYAEKGQEIILNSYIKKRIAKKLGWSEKSALKRVNCEMTKLCKKGVVKKIAPDVHAVNPELIGKGNWAQVKKFRATFNLIGTNAGIVQPEME